jgi:hypothetical protein
MKDRTNQEPSDPTLGSLPDDAEWLGIDSTQRGGNRSAAEIASRRLPEGWAQPSNHGEAPAETETRLEQVLDPANIWLKLYHGAEVKIKVP